MVPNCGKVHTTSIDNNTEAIVSVSVPGVLLHFDHGSSAFLSLPNPHLF